MTHRPARFRQVDLERAMKAARKAGYEDLRLVLRPSGEIEMTAGRHGNGDLAAVELD